MLDRQRIQRIHSVGTQATPASDSGRSLPGRSCKRRGSPAYPQGPGFVAAMRTKSITVGPRQRPLTLCGVAAAAGANTGTDMRASRARPHRRDHGCQALCRWGTSIAGYALIRDTAGIDLDAASDELNQHEVVEPSFTLPPLASVPGAAAEWQAAQGSRRRTCAASSSQNHDCCRGEGRSPDPGWPLQ
jgi:hypothetical protein